MRRALRLLIYGYAGSGKTTVLATAPRPLGVIDFEGGSDRLLGGLPDITIKVVSPHIRTRKIVVKEREVEVSFHDSYFSLKKALAELQKLPLKSLAFDGFSTFVRKRLLEIVAYRHLGQPYAEQKRPEYQDWFTLQLEMDNFLQQFIFANNVDLIVFICHRRQNKQAGSLFVPDILPMKLMDNVVGYMDVVAYTGSPGMDLSLEPFRLYLQPDSNHLFFAKNRFGHPAESEPNLSSLMRQWGWDVPLLPPLVASNRPTEETAIPMTQDDDVLVDDIFGDSDTNDLPAELPRSANPQTQEATGRKDEKRARKAKGNGVDEMWQRLISYASVLGLSADEVKETFTSVCQELDIKPASLRQAPPEVLREVEELTKTVLADQAVERQGGMLS